MRSGFNPDENGGRHSKGVQLDGLTSFGRTTAKKEEGGQRSKRWRRRRAFPSELDIRMVENEDGEGKEEERKDLTRITVINFW